MKCPIMIKVAAKSEYKERKWTKEILNSNNPFGIPDKFVPPSLAGAKITDDAGDGHLFIAKGRDGKHYSLDNEKFWDTRDPKHIKIEKSDYGTIKENYNAFASVKEAAAMKYPIMLKTAWSGIRKFKSLPNVHFVKGERARDVLYGAYKQQKPIKAIMSATRKVFGKDAYKLFSKGFKRGLISDMDYVEGTIGKGKKVYVNMNNIHSSKELRDVINHERFHTLPIIGESETLAHMYGGAFSKKKGDIFSRISGAAKGYGYLWESRPESAIGELILPAGIVSGAIAINKNKKNSKNNDESKLS